MHYSKLLFLVTLLMLLGCSNGQDGDVRGQLAGNDSITTQSDDSTVGGSGAGCVARFERTWIFLGSYARIIVEISSRTWPVKVNHTTTWYNRYISYWVRPEVRGLHEETVTVTADGIDNTCTAEIQVQ